jgi:thiol:disulfide interchange protein
MHLNPEWKIALSFILAGLAIWFLTRVDEEARRNVELRRHLWEGKSTYEKEFEKYRKGVRWVCVILLILALVIAAFSAIPLFRWG